MVIQELTLQNYRCFTNDTFVFNKKFVLIEGDNGSGKTSILEALHYSCFLRSFRTNRIHDLIALEKDHFFLRVSFDAQAQHNQIQIGLSNADGAKKRVIKVNEKPIRSYKDLIGSYKIISLAEDDLKVVSGSPDGRRSFIDQLIILFNPDFVVEFRTYKQILEQRNKMLQYGRPLHIEEFKVWTEQLWTQALKIQTERVAHLNRLQNVVNNLLKDHFGFLNLSIYFNYASKKLSSEEAVQSFESFWEGYKTNVKMEQKLQRSLFGSHLDDFSIVFQDKKARHFASRGQQKLVVFLMKIALAQELQRHNIEATLLLDDFLTDFDYKKLTHCLDLLAQLTCQVFITCPLKALILDVYKDKAQDIQVISL